MNPIEHLQSLYGELEVLRDLERRLRALTEFDKLQVHVHRSGEVIDLDPVQFMQPLVNKVRDDIRRTSTNIQIAMQSELNVLHSVTINHGPVTIGTPPEPAKGPQPKAQEIDRGLEEYADEGEPFNSHSPEWPHKPIPHP